MSRHEVFNPVKEDESGKKAKRVIWSSTSLALALRGIETGRRLIANPFYENNVRLLKADLVYERTEEEVTEWTKCRNDIIYFANTYCKLMTPQGIEHIELRDYQRDYLQHLIDHRLSIFLSCRQSGKTTTSSIFMLHYILFNVDKSALVVGNKFKTAKDILDKLKNIFYEIPYFLKPGVIKWNESEIVLDNGCRCIAEATTQNSGIGFTFHCVLADEFAHIAPNIVEPFYNNLFPTIAASQARFIISSTQNGHNLFETLYRAAESGESEYAPFKVDWYQVPEWNPQTKSWENRDEVWHARQIANMGGEEAFNQQFGTDFDSVSNTLIARKTLNSLTQSVCPFVTKDMPGCVYADRWTWALDFEPYTDARNCFLITTTDIAEGGGGDYTVHLVSKLLGNDKLEQIGLFRANDLSRSDCAHALYDFIRICCHQERVLVSLEWNGYGELFLGDLEKQADWEYAGILVKYYKQDGKSFTYGIKYNSTTKSKYCNLFKEAVETGSYIIKDKLTFNELGNFENIGNNRYRAVTGHDDIIMAAIQTECVKSTLQFKYLEEYFIDSGNTAQDNQTYFVLPKLNNYEVTQLNDFYNRFTRTQYT